MIALVTPGFAAAALGQSTTSSTVMFTLGYTEGPGGNGNNVIEPGESAVLHLTISFTNQNTIGTYAPFPPGNGMGTIRGLGHGFIDLNGSATSGEASGSWDVDPNVHGYGVNSLWDLVGNPSAWGTPAHSGATLINVQGGQYAEHNFSINPTNPVADFWTGLWTPASYAPRTVTFQSTFGTSSGGDALASSVYFKTSSGFAVHALCPHIFGSVQIPIAPAPATSLLLAPLLFPRRHRRRHA